MTTETLKEANRLAERIKDLTSTIKQMKSDLEYLKTAPDTGGISISYDKRNDGGHFTPIIRLGLSFWDEKDVILKLFEDRLNHYTNVLNESKLKLASL